MSLTQDENFVKEEPNLKEECVLEDDIKIEEPCLQESLCTPIPPPSVIIEQKLLICSMCNCTFERKTSIKVRTESDVNKCNKCILHTKLSEVFSGNCITTYKKRKKSRQKEKNSLKKSQTGVLKDIFDNQGHHVDATPREESKTQSILIKKVMYVCVLCKTQFERMDFMGLKEASDWYKCNKCILHSRLNKIFQSGRCIQIPK